MATPSSELQEMMFFIVDNMNRGSKLLTDQEQKNEVAQLNLAAGEKALIASAFHSAAKYLLAGLSLLGEDSWDTKHYNLTIKLYDAGTSYAKLSIDILLPSQTNNALFDLEYRHL